MVLVMVIGIIIINITKLSGWSCKRLTRFTSATDHISKDPPSPPSAALVLPPLQIMLMLYVVMTMMMFTIILLFGFHSWDLRGLDNSKSLFGKTFQLFALVTSDHSNQIW